MDSGPAWCWTIKMTTNTITLCFAVGRFDGLRASMMLDHKNDNKYNNTLLCCGVVWWTQGQHDAALCRWDQHDAAREGDAKRISNSWKLAFLQFHLKYHTDYIHTGFTVIAQQSGLFSKRSAVTVKENRFINLNGGKGNNVSLDHAMEFYNGYVNGKGQVTLKLKNHETRLQQSPGSPVYQGKYW